MALFVALGGVAVAAGLPKQQRRHQAAQEGRGDGGKKSARKR